MNIPVHVWANLWKLPDDLPKTVNGITFTRNGETVHASGTSTSWAVVSSTISLESGTYTLEHMTSTGIVFAELKSTSSNVDLFSANVSLSKGECPAADDYQCIVSVKPNTTVDADITPVLRKLS
ncbi:hypothetical protein [Bifidobacterium longum]|uniref:hypothetical protein n=1 Tax=Bifidobacterium longum TaxID=216816 RepID=UPI001F610786|nr:hypothetical protein [Bifidobacterium longum]